MLAMLSVALMALAASGATAQPLHGKKPGRPTLPEQARANMPDFGGAPATPGNGQNAGPEGQSMVINARDLANHGSVIGRDNTGRVPANVIAMLKTDRAAGLDNNNAPQVPDNVGILAVDTVSQQTFAIPPPPRFMPSGL